jgi:hypothetical protein
MAKVTVEDAEPALAALPRRSRAILERQLQFLRTVRRGRHMYIHIDRGCRRCL